LFHIAIARYPLLERRYLAQLLFRFFRVVPKVRRLRFFFFFLYFNFFAIDVKDTPSAHARAPAVLLPALL
jgi:hypothetical protein